MRDRTMKVAATHEQYHAYRMVEATARRDTALLEDEYLALRAASADFDPDLLLDSLVGLVGMLARCCAPHCEGGIDELLAIIERFSR